MKRFIFCPIIIALPLLAMEPVRESSDDRITYVVDIHSHHSSKHGSANELLDQSALANLPPEILAQLATLKEKNQLQLTQLELAKKKLYLAIATSGCSILGMVVTFLITYFSK